MYLAELKGKLPSQYEGWEDVLTSNVFSFLKYSSRTLYLRRFLEGIGISDISDTDLETAEFIFWPVYQDGTEPDVVLLVGKYYLLFEAKYGANFGEESANRKHQLVREISDGIAEANQDNRAFWLIAITADACYRSEKFIDVPLEYRRYIKWTNWQAVSRILKEVAECSSYLPEDLFAKDLFLLLERKKLRGFQSFDGLSFTGNLSQEVFFEAASASYRGDFIGFTEVLASFDPIAIPERKLFFRKQFFANLPLMYERVPEQIFLIGGVSVVSVTLAEQTKNAFEFIRKLYFEISYLIKEIEGLLQEEDEKFVIGRPSGYGVTTRSSTGLDSYNVDLWLNKTFTVFFCQESMTEFKGGQSITEFNDHLKLMIVHIKLIEKGIEEPQIYFGCIKDIKSKRTDYKKFEHMMWEFSYNGDKIFANNYPTTYDDSYCSFNGDFRHENLYDIKNSEDVRAKIIEPMLKVYRGYNIG